MYCFVVQTLLNMNVEVEVFSAVVGLLVVVD